MEHLSDEFSAARAIAASAIRPVILYKHSPLCGLSDAAQIEFDRFRESEKSSGRFSFYQVDVIAARSASRKVEALLGVLHESPQVLMVSDSRCVWHGSHRAIREARLRSEAESLWHSRTVRAAPGSD
ncbi:MAG: bacillithiol system redox-active protein YtxJ [Fibrobacteria bacterium]